MTRLLDRLNRGVSGLCVLLFILLFLVISLQIVSRYFLREPFIWTEECARFLFIWICFLGISVVHRKKSHVTIDFLVNMFSARVRNYISLFVHTLTTLFWGFLIVDGIELAERGSFLAAVTLSWLNWGHIYAAVPVSASVMLLYSVNDLSGHIHRMISAKGRQTG